MFGAITSGTGAALAGGASLAGSLTGQGAGFSAAAKARHFNHRMAKDQRRWQKMMSDTAFQRQSRDLEKAGLNRVLAMTQGGASTPSGASASVR